LGSHLWYSSSLFSNGTLKQFDEDRQFSLLDLSESSLHPDADMPYAYNISDIENISYQLGIPWESSKDIPISFCPTFIGLIWDLQHLPVEIMLTKWEKYLMAIMTWTMSTTYTLQQVQQFYLKLLHSCLVIPAGQS